MKVLLYSPSPMEGRVLQTSDDPKLKGVHMGVQPIQFYKSQRSLFATPFAVLSEQGRVLDRGYVTVNSRTGKLSIEHRIEEVTPEADQVPSASTSGKASRRRSTDKTAAESEE